MLSDQANPILLDAVAATALYLIAVPAALTVWAIVFRRRLRLDVFEAIAAGIVTIALVKMGGALYVHARPFVAYHRQPLVPHAADNAFPSDHLAACGLAAAYLWTRRRVFAAATVLCAALIGAARVLAGLHWPIDVVSGFAMGVGAAIAARVVITLLRQRFVRRRAG